MQLEFVTKLFSLSKLWIDKENIGSRSISLQFIGSNFDGLHSTFVMSVIEEEDCEILWGTSRVSTKNDLDQYIIGPPIDLNRVQGVFQSAGLGRRISISRIEFIRPEADRIVIFKSIDDFEVPCIGLSVEAS